MSQISPPNQLTPKQLRFVRYYIKNLGNPGKAAKLAGYKGSSALLEAQARSLLENRRIRAEITAQINASRLDANMILHQIQAIATANIGDFLDFDEDGNIRWDLQRAKAAMKLGVVKSIKQTRNGLDVELYDKLAALKLLGQHEALFVTVSRAEDWRISAIRDIQNERVGYKDLIEAFGDPALVGQLFIEAGVQLPPNALLPAEIIQEDIVEAEYVDEEVD